MRAERLEEIRAVVWCEPWKDNQLFPDLLVRLFNELGAIAVDPYPVFREWALTPLADRAPVQAWAEQLLEVLELRARSGIPFDEPYGDEPPTNPEDL